MVARKTKNPIETALTQAENLRMNKDANVFAQTSKPQEQVTQATEQAGQKVAEKSKGVQQGVQDTLAGVPVIQDVYATGTPRLATPGQVQVTSPMTDYSTIAGLLKGPGLETVNTTAEQEKQAISQQKEADIAKAKAEEAATKEAISKKIGAGQEKLSKAEKAAAQPAFGEVGKRSEVEARSEALNKILAGDMISNIQALSAMRPNSYDPRLASLESQIYNEEIQAEKTKAGLLGEQQKSAEDRRAMAIEDYLKGIQKGKETLSSTEQFKFGKAEIKSANAVKNLEQQAQNLSDLADRAGSAAGRKAMEANKNNWIKGIEDLAAQLKVPVPEQPEKKITPDQLFAKKGLSEQQQKNKKTAQQIVDLIDKQAQYLDPTTISRLKMLFQDILNPVEQEPFTLPTPAKTEKSEKTKYGRFGGEL